MFSKIKLCFLPPGHTYEDVDQMFSTFHKALLKFDIETLGQFFTFINSSYLMDETRPELHPLEWVWDFKGWLHPFMVNLEGHSQPRMVEDDIIEADDTDSLEQRVHACYP